MLNQQGNTSNQIPQRVVTLHSHNVKNKPLFNDRARRSIARAKIRSFKQTERPVLKITYLSKEYTSIEFSLTAYNCLTDERTGNICKLSNKDTLRVFELYLEGLREELKLKPHRKAAINRYAEQSTMTPLSACLVRVPVKKLDDLIDFILEVSRRVTNKCETCKLKNRQEVSHSIATQRGVNYVS